MAKYDKRRHALERIVRYCSEVTAAVERFGNSISAFHVIFACRNTCAMSWFRITIIWMKMKYGAPYRRIFPS
jgi:hypothetical protein